MIVVDTSALMAIANDEPMAEACLSVLSAEPLVLMSAGTLAEALIVAAGRGITQQMSDVVEQSRMEIVPVTAATARRIGAIYIRFGKGFHPAGLNYGDCFAYELAMQRDCPLLFVGEDFARTDVKRAIGS